MLEYDRICKYEGIDVNKTDSSHECIICHYLYFPEISFKYQPKVGNGCNDLMPNAMDCNDGAIVSGKGNDYRTQFFVYE